MASFKAKTVWKMPRKRENKNYCFVAILSGADTKWQKKKGKKFKKLKKYHYGTISSQNILEKARKERK